MPGVVTYVRRSILCGLLLLSESTVVRKQSRNMSSWAVEKNVIVNMDLESKRKLYKVGSYVTLDQVDSWKKQAESLAGPEQRDVEMFGDTRIRSELNSVLADKISVWKGDITRLEIDAVVNAANAQLRGGGGVDGAIHRAAGKFLSAECSEIGGCPTGQARMTGGYNMPAKYIIHTVGPTNKSHEALENCYKSCFALQEVNELKSIAFPCIATGVYHFPNVQASHIALAETRRFLEEDHLHRGGLVERVIFCVFEPVDEQIYKSAAQLYFPLA